MPDNYPYRPARSGLRYPRPPGVRPSIAIVHTMEAAERSTTAENCAQWFQAAAARGAAHLCIDNNSIVRSAHWVEATAGAKGSPYRGRSVNAYAIHFEHAGFASQTRQQWTDDYSQATLFWSALAMARACRELGITITRLSDSQIRAGESGICGHGDISRALSVRGGHWDPGPAFPWSEYLAATLNWSQHV
jgi:hypothetical protein